jgi:hypothetical protein
MKKLFALLLILAGLTLLTSCGGDEDTDPKPVKTDLELIQEGIVGYWDLQSITVEKTGETPSVFTGNTCDESSYPSWVQANVGNIDYRVTTSSNITVNINCPSLVTDDFKYTIVKEGDKYIMNITDGRVFEFVNGVNAISGNEITLKIRSNLYQGATASTWRFKKI